MVINPNEACFGSLLYYSLSLEHRGLGRAYVDLEIVEKEGRSLINCGFKIRRHLS